MRALLVTGVLSIVIGIAAAVFSTNYYSMAADGMENSDRNLTIAKEALDAAGRYPESDPKQNAEVQKAADFKGFAESDLNWHDENIDVAAVLTVVSVVAVLAGAIVLVVRRRRRTRDQRTDIQTTP
ncbi:hypothetical protein AB0F52_30250 [Amycolatopsis sp. NPDC024027]|uniref:hypothetical protein n=1 Tax=Amycolatopsis sp. NPDC024027 TaxID=3154327 RepID=UPI0033F07771